MATAHPELLWIVIASGITCAFLAISIGANDVANAFSTSVGSGTLSLRGAITIAFIFEILGSLFLGGRVTDAIRTRVLNFSTFSDSPYELALGMLCSSVGSTLWLIFATYFGIPVSTTHSIIGALAGFGIASGRLSSVRWLQLLYIILSWFFVPVISIVVTGTFYVIIQELILKRTNSFRIMYNYHWVFLILFAIPLSVFIAFENSFLRATEGKLSDTYRKWFYSSNWNKLASVIIVLSIFVLFSCLVTYTICYFRLKSGWSFLESIRNMDQMFTDTPKSEEVKDLNNKDKNDNVDKIVENQTNALNNIPHSEETYTDHYSDIYTNDNITLPGQLQEYLDLKNEEKNNSEFHITINTESMDSNIRGDRIDLSEGTKKSFSRSIIDALLGSVGFSMTPRCSRQVSRFSSSDLSVRFGESQEITYDPSMHRQTSRFNRFFSNIWSSYSRTLSRSRSNTRFRRFSGRRFTTHSGRSQSSTSSRETTQPKTTRFSGMTPQMRDNLNKTQVVFSAMQIVGATISIISHSANDTANAVSPFATIYFLYLDGPTQTTKNTPWFILLCGGLCMSLGLACFGYKVIKTVGLNITRVTPSRGYTIDSTAGGIVLVLSHIGIPLSSTHVTVSSIFGIGLIEHVPSLSLSLDLNSRLEDKKSTESKAEQERHMRNKEDNEEDKDSISSSSMKEREKLGVVEQDIELEDKQNTNLSTDSKENVDMNKSNLENDHGLDVKEENKERQVEKENVDGKELNKNEKTENNLNPTTFLSSRLTLKHVNVKLYRKIFFTWIITIFSSGVITALLFLISKVIYKSRK